MKTLHVMIVLALMAGWSIGQTFTDDHRLRAVTQVIEPEVDPDANPLKVDIDVEAGIKVNAQVSCEVGELVRFDARGSDVESLVWDVLPPTDDFEVVDDGFRSFFSARAGGEYLILIAGAKDGKAFLWHQPLAVMGAAPPLTGLTAKVNQWLKLMPPMVKEERNAKLRQMAAIFRTTASDQSVKVDQILDATARANSAVLGEDIQKWIPFLDKLGSELDTLVDADKLKTREQYQGTWSEIATALERNAK
jgi:hypothetical protein